MFGSLNYLAVITAAIVSFLFGGVWYNVFSRQWLEAVGRSPDSLPKGRSEIGLYLLAFAAQLIMAWMLAGVLLHLSLGGMKLGLRSGIISGVLMWLGFVFTTMVVNYSFHGARRALSVIDGGHWLGVLVIQGAILGFWGVR
jgi:Protein of unknown function (DUF1761)